MLHYASPPTVGGVESTIYYHARGLADLGYPVRVISGSGGDFDERIPTLVEPLFGSKHPDVLAAKQSLDGGEVPPTFETLVERLYEALVRTLEGCDVCIVHNVPTLNKNLPLSTALHRYQQTQPLHLLAWCHDLAWTNPQYLPELYEARPWTLLRERWGHTTYVTVSEPRQGEVADLLDMPPEDVYVVLPGVDAAAFYHWTPVMQRLERQLHLLDADGLLLLPARITRRKNIALGLRVLEAVRRLSGRDFRLIVTGPPGPHNPTNPGYLGELLTLRDELALGDSAHFLYAFGENADQPLIPDSATMANLYHTADALLFPTLQEGFGIPALEAGFAGLPVFCSDIPALRRTGQGDAVYFDPRQDSPDDIARRVIEELDARPTYRLRVRARQHYRWDRIIRDVIVPLL